MLAYLKKVSNNFMKSRFNIPHQETMHQIIEVLVKDGRISTFGLAKHRVECPACDVLGYFNERGWQYFNKIEI